MRNCEVSLIMSRAETTQQSCSPSWAAMLIEQEELEEEQRVLQAEVHLAFASFSVCSLTILKCKGSMLQGIFQV